jgi:hypothetical protein
MEVEMNKAIVSLVLVLAAASSPADDPSERLGVLSCVAILKGFGCELQWNFDGTNKQDFKPQMWDPENLEWRNLDESPSLNPLGVRLGEVEPGRIYRVQACNDDGCESSTALWTPDWTDPAEMPDEVIVHFPSEPMTLSISKMRSDGAPNPVRGVMAQYNMYLVLEQASGFLTADAEMPPLNEPVMAGVAPVTVEEMVQYNAHKNYQSIYKEVSNKGLAQ